MWLLQIDPSVSAAESNESDEQARVRVELANEILLLKSLEHPNIVRYLGVELTDDYLYVELCTPDILHC